MLNSKVYENWGALCLNLGNGSLNNRNETSTRNDKKRETQSTLTLAKPERGRGIADAKWRQNKTRDTTTERDKTGVREEDREGKNKC